MTQNNALNSYSEKFEVGPDGAAGATADYPLHVRKDASTNTGIQIKNDSTVDGARAKLQVIANSGTGEFTFYDDSYTTQSVFANKAVINCGTGDGVVINYPDSSSTIKMTRGGDSATAWEMSGDMERTMTHQPCFSATLSAAVANVTGNNTNYTVLFNTERFDQNSDFNTANGIFTAPVTGKYIFTSTVKINDINDGTQRFQQKIATSNVTYQLFTANVSAFDTSDGNGQIVCSVSIIADLDQNDTAYTIIYGRDSGSDDLEIEDGFFTGSLLC